MVRAVPAGKSELVVFVAAVFVVVCHGAEGAVAGGAVGFISAGGWGWV
jgi:hypothetical protein